MKYTKEELEEMASDMGQEPKIRNEDSLGYDHDLDCFKLDDLHTCDADDNPFEEYKNRTILVPRTYPKIIDLESESQILEIVKIYRENGWLVPSMPLACCIINKLMREGVAKVSNGWEAHDPLIYDTLNSEDFPFHPNNITCTNTAINHKRETMMHDPQNGLIPIDYYVPENVSFAFNPASSDKSRREFARNMTGGHMGRIEDIASFYGKGDVVFKYPSEEVIEVNSNLTYVGLELGDNQLIVDIGLNILSEGKVPLYKIIRK